MTPRLAVAGLVAGYEGARVVRDLDLAIEPGQTAVVIGPNGHGKTTMLRAITGLLRPLGGRIELDGARIDGSSAERIASLGIVHVMQGDGLFDEMSVEENLLMGAFAGANWRDRRRALQAAYARFPNVAARREQRARTLSGGERRLVALGRGLMRPARLLVIDEPSLGLAPIAIEAVYDAIRQVREDGVTVLLVEENFGHVGDIADVVHVLESGRIVRSGTFTELANDRSVLAAYLGDGGGA